MKPHNFQRSRLSDLMTYDQYQQLNAWCLADQHVPDHCKVTYNKAVANRKNANLLTKLVMDWMKMCGHFAERTNTTGVMRRNPKTGKMMWTTTQGTKGSSDIKAVVNGRMVAIEIKYGRDRMSEYQHKYKRDIERAGGKYIVCRHLNDVVDNL